MNHETRDSYTKIISLDGGLFDHRQCRVIPLESFRLNECAAPSGGEDLPCAMEEPPPAAEPDEPAPPVRGAEHHSLSPTAMTSTVSGDAPGPEVQPWTLGAWITFGAASLVVAGWLGASSQTQALGSAEGGLTPLFGLDGGGMDASPGAQAADDQATESTTTPAEIGGTVMAPSAAAIPPIAAVLRPSARPTRPAAARMSMLDIPPAPVPIQVPIDRTTAAIAIAVSARRAEGCKSADMGSMSVPVTVTFAPSGQVTRAAVDGGPLAVTSAGSCVAQALRGASVRPFDGPPATVSTTVYLR